MSASELTAVIDIGKTHRRLLVIDDAGVVQHESTAACIPREAPEGYLALDARDAQEWLQDRLAALGPLRGRLRRIVPTTHGAAVAAMRDGALVLPVPDYEFAGFDDLAASTSDGFAHTLSPALPRGLNMGHQLAWLQRHCGAALDRAEVLLPYAQYWSHWLSGVAASEVSSLGCHTQLWRVHEHRFTDWAHTQGWATRFAPLRRAWEVLGTVRPPLARSLGLPAGVQVHCGVHDSNACFARYLRAWPRATLVSTGTWVVIMAAGAPTRQLDPALDLLGNVSVRGEVVPTARFMGGREIEHLAAGADPALADLSVLADLLARQVCAQPGFERQGGPFRDRTGALTEAGRPLPWSDYLHRFTEVERATLAALYAAQVTVWLLEHLHAPAPVVLEGPFARNPVICAVLTALLPPDSLRISVDPVEGTARGAWELTAWTSTRPSVPQVHVPSPTPSLDPLLRRYHDRWQRTVDGEPSGHPPQYAAT